MNDLIIGIAICAMGYFLGSIPFAIWITKLILGKDVRDGGSGHSSTTNTLRQAGLVPGLIVLFFDMGKGFLPIFIALKYSLLDWVVPVTAALVVAGHCWPLFAQFRGGMGLATAGGVLLAIYPLGVAVGLIVLISLTLILKHSARASLIAVLLFAPIFYLLGERGLVLFTTVSMGLVLALRFSVDWNRKYHELWLDRSPTTN